jgi:hypothetical protein
MTEFNYDVEKHSYVLYTSVERNLFKNLLVKYEYLRNTKFIICNSIKKTLTAKNAKSCAKGAKFRRSMKVLCPLRLKTFIQLIYLASPI